jgi:trans-2-enoyl-CoA reductase
LECVTGAVEVVGDSTGMGLGARLLGDGEEVIGCLIRRRNTTTHPTAILFHLIKQHSLAPQTIHHSNDMGKDFPALECVTGAVEVVGDSTGMGLGARLLGDGEEVTTPHPTAILFHLIKQHSLAPQTIHHCNRINNPSATVGRG